MAVSPERRAELGQRVERAHHPAVPNHVEVRLQLANPGTERRHLLVDRRSPLLIRLSFGLEVLDVSLLRQKIISKPIIPTGRDVEVRKLEQQAELLHPLDDLQPTGLAGWTEPTG